MARADAGRDDSYSSVDSGILKIVTRLPWENILNPIIYVGTSHSYPCLFVSLCAPGTTINSLDVRWEITTHNCTMFHAVLGIIL